MTVYTQHLDAIFDPDKPILGSTHLEARDNLLATTEGDATAPKINPIDAMAHQGAALAIGMTANLVRNLEGEEITANSIYPAVDLAVLGFSLVSTASGSLTVGELNYFLGGAVTGTWRALGTTPGQPGRKPGNLFLRIT